MSFTPRPVEEEGFFAKLWVVSAWLLGAAFALFLGLITGFHIWAPSVIEQFQTVRAYTAENTIIFNRNDETLATIEGAEDRHTVPLSRISPYLVKAVVGIEDRRFFGHRGMDPIRLVGAIWADLQAMAFHQGASTITQQLVKLTLLSPERTLSRKIREIFMALALEREFSKEQLLEFYLNQLYFGHGLYGVEKASSAYFRKRAADLTLAEAAFLAALIKKPEGYLAGVPQIQRQGDSATLLVPPADGPLMRRQRLALKTLRRHGWASREEYQAALAEPLVVHNPVEAVTNAPYFVQHVLKELRDLLQVSRISGRGFRVYTTLDPAMQKAAEAVMTRLSTDSSPADQGALVALETGTGEVRALVGGVDFSASQFNRATQARRQPGSAFKPILYAAAFEQGYTPTSVFMDQPVRYVRAQDGGYEEGGYEEVYEPHNYGERYGILRDRGDAILPLDHRMTLGQALVRSSNVIAVQLLDEVGLLSVRRLARRLGIELRTRMGLCVALGCSELSLLELTSAYASFANGGFRTRPVFIRKVTDSKGKVLYEHIPDPPEQVISPWTAFQINHLLQRVIRRGTGWRARIGRPAGGKTGTNDGPRDTWFIGFTPGLTAGVWMGNDDNGIVTNEVGGRTTARMWRDFMTRALPPYDGEGFVEPGEPYVAVRTCAITGETASEWCPQTVLTYHLEHAAPAQVCTLHQGALKVYTVCSESGLLVSAYCPLETREQRNFYAQAQVPPICDVHTPEILLLGQSRTQPNLEYIGKFDAHQKPPRSPYAQQLSGAFASQEAQAER